MTEVQHILPGIKLHYNKLSFTLPEERIAARPQVNRDRARLMVLNKYDGSIKQHTFGEFTSQLKKDDLIIYNDSLVEKRRVFLRRATGARIEAIFLHSEDGIKHEVLLKKSRRIKPGEKLTAESDASLVFEYAPAEKPYLLSGSVLTTGVFDRVGQMPIPPYMGREADEEDDISYQNPFGTKHGSVAAPTSLLHFSPGSLQALHASFHTSPVTLHIGYGTFQPLVAENFEKKQLHGEWYHIPDSTARKLRQQKGRVVVLGTTALRAIETAFRQSQGTYSTHLQGVSRLFLHPPDRIESADCLLTNFHLPGSSLILLTACMIDSQLLMNAYDFAIEHEYMFYSYGDAMFISG